MAKKDPDLIGFTTNYFNRCVICKRELDQDFVTTHYRCECSAVIAKIKLQPKQDELAKLVLATGPEVPTKLGYYGPRAGGKSRGLRDISLIVSSECGQMYTGAPAFLLRRNWTQCQESLLEKFKIERPYLADFYNGQEKQYQFPPDMGGGRIAFKYADTPDDILRLERGPECFFMGIDQAEQISKRDLQRLNSPNRWPDTPPGAAKTAYFLNPGGIGSNYLREKFVDRKFEENERPGDFHGIFAAGWHNFAWFVNQGIDINNEPLTWELFYSLPDDVPVPPDGKYTNKWLASIPDDNRFKLFVTKTSEGAKHWSKPDTIRMGDLFGRFDSFEGQYFPGVDMRKVTLR